MAGQSRRYKTNRGGQTRQVVIDEPNEKQKLFFEADTRYIGYGGAKGGGKSWAVRVKGFLGCLCYPGIRVLMMRLHYPELNKNLIQPLLQMVPPEMAVYNGQEHLLTFENGSTITFGHWNGEQSMNEYNGLGTTASAARTALGAAAKWAVLWTNNYPTSKFAAQTVRISNLSSCNLFYIAVNWSTGYPAVQGGSIAYVPGTSEARINPGVPWFNGGAIANSYRGTYINRGENTVKFLSGTLTQKNSVKDYTDYAVPLYILGTAI